MLSNDLLIALKSYTANMKKQITFVLQTGEHAKRQELIDFLSSVAEVSGNILFEDIPTAVPSGINGTSIQIAFKILAQ